MKARTWIILGVVAFGAIFLAPSATTKYNNIVTVDEAWGKQNGQVNNVLSRESRLLPNLASTANAYMNGEQRIFVGTAVGRAGKAAEEAKSATPGTDDAAKKQTAAILAGQQAVAAFNMVREAYPELKSNKNFETLMAEIAGSENRVSVERRQLQIRTEAFNREVRYFPGKLYAIVFGFSPKAYFDIDESEKKAPKLDFPKG